MLLQTTKYFTCNRKFFSVFTAIVDNFIQKNGNFLAILQAELIILKFIKQDFQTASNSV